MLNKKIIEFGAGRSTPSNGQQPANGQLLNLALPGQPPDFPVLPETLLRMELCLGGTSVSLRALSQVLLADLGATIEIFRRAGREPGSTAMRPNRIEDCISYLGVHACIDTLADRVGTRSPRRGGVDNAWNHAGTIADACSYWVELNSENINPAEAYLVGLFHELGTLPAVLGWDGRSWGKGDACSRGLRIAVQCGLPNCVRQYFSDGLIQGTAYRWAEVVDVAHELPSSSPIPCPIEKVHVLHSQAVL